MRRAVTGGGIAGIREWRYAYRIQTRTFGTSCLRLQEQQAQEQVTEDEQSPADGPDRVKFFSRPPEVKKLEWNRERRQNKDVHLYRFCKELAQEGKNPTPERLSELFGMMLFNSPYGELKNEVFTIWREARSRGLKLDENGYVRLLKMASFSGDSIVLDEILGALHKDGTALNPKMLDQVIAIMITNDQVDRAILLFRELRAKGFTPVRNSFFQIIYTCLANQELEEAFTVLLEFKELHDISQESRLYYSFLEACAQQNYLEGTLHCWQILQNLPRQLIPEGLCLDVLSTAAKNGHPALAASVFHALSKLGITYGSHHFLPLIEAYVRAGDIRQAFIAINIMRESSVTPQISHLHVLIDALGASSSSLDKAFFILQDLVEKEGKSVDIVAFNCLLSAALRRNDVARMMTTYRDAGKLKVQSNIETYNILLHSAQSVAHVDLAMHILSDLKAAGVKPNQQTYERVIMTYLVHPGDYQTAFLYLEELKAAGYIPSGGLYQTFAKKCFYHNDDRALTILDEMEKVGYSVKEFQSSLRQAREEAQNSSNTIFSRLSSRLGHLEQERRETEEALRQRLGQNEENVESESPPKIEDAGS